MGHHKILKQKDISYNDWASWCIWSLDGRAARHPTFELVLNSDIFKRQLMSQVFVSLRIPHQINPNTTVRDFVREEMSDPVRSRKFSDNVNHYVLNVCGTDQYFSKIRNQFRASNFYNTYLKQMSLSIFHTMFLVLRSMTSDLNLPNQEEPCSSLLHWRCI